MSGSDSRDTHLRRQVELMGLLAHDVKNPISAALANLAFVEQVGASDPEAGEAIRDASDAVKRVRQLLDDIVVATKHEAHLLDLHELRVPLEPVVAQAVGALAKDAQLRRTTIDVEETTASAKVDTALVSRALELLLDCALRWGKPGGRIAVRATAGDEVTLSVSHDSCALGDQIRARAFIDHGASKPAAIGLSLYYAHCVADAHGGRLVLHAQPAVLSLVLPKG